jgi:hypothetical protein
MAGLWGCCAPFNGALQLHVILCWGGFLTVYSMAGGFAYGRGVQGTSAEAVSAVYRRSARDK